MSTPVITSNIPSPGVWCTESFAVIFTVNQPNCNTFYTLDGSDPVTSITRIQYTVPFIIQNSTTIKFYTIQQLPPFLASATQTQTVLIDSQAPVTSINVVDPDGANSWYIASPTITLSAIDTVSLVAKTYYSWDGVTFQEYDPYVPLTIPNQGIHYLQYYSIDNANNKESVQTRIFKFDYTAPTTQAIIPLDTSYEPVTVTFEITDNASTAQMTYYTYTDDGSTPPDPTINSSSGSSIDFNSSGLYTIKFFSVDDAGNSEIGSIKQSQTFRIEFDSSAVLQVLITESFPANGKNGWYISSPQISLLTTKPTLVTELKYKIAPKNKPTTATFTSTVHITGTIDLFDGANIAIELDQSSQPLVINVRGTDSRQTSITDIIDKINNTVGTIIASETGSDGLAGSGYVTLTSPTAGLGLPTSEIKFVSPGSFDATLKVFGLDPDHYPYTYTETYLYQDYTTPFVLPSDNVWIVNAEAKTDSESVTAQKTYNLDVGSPTTTIIVDPAPVYGFYTTSPTINFTAIDTVSGIKSIIYQFNSDPTLKYYTGTSLYLPHISSIIKLVYFSIDNAGNIEQPQEMTFDYDFVAPTTTVNELATTDATIGTNDTVITCALADIIGPARPYDITSPTYSQYDFPLLDTSLKQTLHYSPDWTDLVSYLNSLNLDFTTFAFTAANIFPGFSGITGLSSWSDSSTGLTYRIQAIYSFNGLVFAGSLDGIYISADNGVTWSQTAVIDPIMCFTSIGNTIFAGTGDLEDPYTGYGIWSSTDNGLTWATVNTGLTDLRVHCLTVKGTDIFAGTYGGGIFRSSNNGASWIAVNTGLPLSYSYLVLSLAVSGTNIFAGTYAGIFVSTNGVSWTLSSGGLIGDSLAVYSLAVMDDKIFAGTGGGAYISIDGGVNWTSINNNLTNVVNFNPSDVDISGNKITVSQDWINYDIVQFTTTGTLPAPLQINTSYTIDKISATEISLLVPSPSFPYNLIPVDLTTQGSGLHTITSKNIVLSLTVSGNTIFAGTLCRGARYSIDNGTNWNIINTGLTNTDVRSFTVVDNVDPTLRLLLAGTADTSDQFHAYGGVSKATGIWNTNTITTYTGSYVIVDNNYQTGDVVQLSLNPIVGAALPVPLLTDTNYYVIRLSSSCFKLALTYDDSQSSTAISLTGSGNNCNVQRARPEVIIFNNLQNSKPIDIYLAPVDDIDFEIIDEQAQIVTGTAEHLVIANSFIKAVDQIYDETASVNLTLKYFNNTEIYTVEPLISGHTYLVSYHYTYIDETYYTTDGSTPSILSPTTHHGQLITLPDSGSYDLKWFSIDGAGNQETIRQFAALLVIINVQSTIRGTIVESIDTNTLYAPNGNDNWYKINTFSPAIKIEFANQQVFIYNENSTITGVSGTGPYTVTIQVNRVDVALDQLSNATLVKNITTGETYNTFTVAANIITATSIAILPNVSDVLIVDYSFETQQNLTPGSQKLILGDPNNPDSEPDFTGSSSPYLINPYSFQGSELVTIQIQDKRDKIAISNLLYYDLSIIQSLSTIKLDILAPITTDNIALIPSTWLNTDQTVILTSVDPISLFPSNQSASGICFLYYSIDGGTIYSITTVNPNIINLTTSGDYDIRYYAEDFAGNLEAIKIASHNVKIDKDAPITSVVVVPPDGINDWYVTSPAIDLFAADSFSGVFKTVYKWDDALSFTDYTTTLAIPSEGIHTLYFYSQDNAGNIEQVKSQEFKLDTIAPVTTDDISGQWTNDKVITFISTDTSSGTYRTYYTIDTFIPPDPTLSSAFTTNSTITVPVDGIYFVKYFSIDNAGNIESVKTATNAFYLDLIKPVLDPIQPIDPADLIFTTATHLTVNFTDDKSGIDVNTIKIFVDDIEYSIIKNSSFFSYTGSSPVTPGSGYLIVQAKVGPVASIPNFDNIESVVIRANDVAGNALDPVVVNVEQTDIAGPYIRNFWPRDKATDVSRETNVMFLIDDDVSVDIRSIVANIANVEYRLVTTDVINVVYSGAASDVFISIEDYLMMFIVGGIVIDTINLTHSAYSTVKKVSDYINTLSDFQSTIIDREFDQIPSIDFVTLHRARVNNTLTLSVATFENNKNINYMSRGHGYLITITPNEIFEDNVIVNVSIDATDFANNAMTTETFSFTCKDICTPARTTRDKWYQYQIEIIKNIESNLESTYNKNTISTVFYGYFKMLALEIARAKQTAESFRDDIYTNTNTSQSMQLLYQNLGYLLKLKPQTAFSTTTAYETALLTLMQMFFKGSTKENIESSLGIFLGLEDNLSAPAVRITEYLDDWVRRFTFSFDIDAGTTVITNWDEFNAIITDVLKSIKPAHTYFLVRYFFSEIIRTKDIQDDLIKFEFDYHGSENVRTDCADKYKVADIITENVSHQFTGTNNCCFTYYKPVLSWDETTVATNVSDVQVTASGGPINVISVDGLTGQVCFDRSPSVTETVELVYKFNKYAIIRQLSFYLNTYTVTGGTFDITQPYLLNRVNETTSVISYDIPEDDHAHICETKISIEVDFGTIYEKVWQSPDERLFFNAFDSYEDVLDFDITEQLDFKVILKETVDQPIEQVTSILSQNIYESVQTIRDESGIAVETNAWYQPPLVYTPADKPYMFWTNDTNSNTNTLTDMLFYWIERHF